LRKLFEKAGFEVVDVVGKTIIPVRNNKHLRRFRGAVERLMEMEKNRLSKDPASAGRAGHLQIVARKPVNVAD